VSTATFLAALRPLARLGYFAGVMATSIALVALLPAAFELSAPRGYSSARGSGLRRPLYLPEDDVLPTRRRLRQLYSREVPADAVKRRMGDNFGLPNAMTHETDV